MSKICCTFVLSKERGKGETLKYSLRHAFYFYYRCVIDRPTRFIASGGKFGGVLSLVNPHNDIQVFDVVQVQEDAVEIIWCKVEIIIEVERTHIVKCFLCGSVLVH